MRTVLLVDDNAELLRAVRRMLALAGWRVLPVTTAEAALELLRRERVSVVITDYLLENSENGAWLRERVHDVPVILMTGIYVKPSEERMFDGVVRKPVDAATLITMLNRMTTNGGAAHA